MLKRGLTFGGVLAILSAVFVSNAFAESANTDFNIKVNSSLSLSVSSANVGFQLTPTQAGSYDSASFNVYSSTNNPTGYKLIMSTNKVDLESNAINPTTGTKPTIPTLTETQNGITAAAFEASTSPDVLNHWGISVAGANYNAMKSTQEIKTTIVNNVTEDTTVISLASKLDLLTVPGVYSTTINFQLVANTYTEDGSINENGRYPANSLLRAFEIAYTKAGKPMYIEDANTDIGWRPMVGADFNAINDREVRFAMQDVSMTFEENGVTHNVCEWATASAADNSYINEAPVMDIRDGKTYWIAKLADGKCWMTQNLDLNLVHMANDEDALYTHANTDLGWGTDAATTKWNPERSTFSTSDIAADGTIPGWINYISDPYSLDSGDWYWTDTWYTTGVNNYLSGNAGDKFSQTPYTGNGQHGHVGNYYNWTAAIASNDSSSYRTDTSSDLSSNPQNSICPAGWRLPTISNVGWSAVGSTSEFARLAYLYGQTNSTDQYYTANPLYFVRGGYISAYNLSDPGDSGFYWSSTVGNNDNVYWLRFFYSDIWATTWSTVRGYGFSIRCVAR